MAILPILAHPDPRLRETSQPVTVFDEELARLVANLSETLRVSGGIGLAAPQTGDRRQVLVIDLSGGESPPEVYINPELHPGATQCLVEESCLSVPGVVGNVVRAISIRVRAQDPQGNPFEQELEGMPAVCLQHEVDHLRGTLFIDRLPLLQRLRLRLRRGQSAQAPAAATG